MLPRVSIVVPTRRVDDFVLECVRECRKLDYPDFEIIVVSDVEEPAPEGARLLASGPVLPGTKRNLAARAATGDVLAFIDADAYPRPDWLRNAVRHLQGGAGAVGGPGITPPHDPRLAQVSGLILGSALMGGALSARYAEGEPHESDDIHSCNFVAWRKVVEEAGGWSEQYWPGEDTLVCRAIKLAGHRQLLAPDVVVFHHRRASWKAHVRQIWNYAVHRGFFMKRFPETSRRTRFLVPSAFVVGLVAGPLAALAFPPAGWAYAAVVVGYLGACALAALKSPKYRGSVFAGIPLTHVVYGVGVIVGLVRPRLSR